MPGRHTGIYPRLVVVAAVLSVLKFSAESVPPAAAEPMVPEGLQSDRDLPRREWLPEIHPVPGAEGRPTFVNSLTLKSAIVRALDYNPAVKAAFLEIEARHGEETQAAVKPNPELLVELENFAGSKDKSGFGAAETTFSLAQTIELGDKRLRRLQAAHLDASLATWDYEVVRVQIAAQTARAFVDVLAAQARIAMLKEFVTIAAKTQASVDARVKGGKASPIELDKTIIATARAKALLKSEEARFEAAKKRLAIFWGAEKVDFGRASGRLGNGKKIPSLASLKASIEANPSLARWSDEIGRRMAQLDVEVGRSVPDIKVGAGLRQFGENGSVAAVASVSIPLQFFDKNSGNIIAAGQRIAKAERDRDNARNELLALIVEALGELEVAATQLRVFEDEVLPPALSAFERTKIGYDEGKFDILNVLDAQRSVFEARLEVVIARAEFEKARVKLEAIAGRDLGAILEVRN